MSVALIACILLMALTIFGQRRAWWLIGLAPVLALFAHRFAPGSAALGTTVLENPYFVAAERSRSLMMNGWWV